MSAQFDTLFSTPVQPPSCHPQPEVAVTQESSARDHIDHRHHARLLDEILTMLGRRISVYAGRRRTSVAVRHGISAGALRMLDLIVELAPLSTGHLTRLSGLSAGSITAILDRLEEAGLINRAKHPGDRRVIMLTPDLQRCAMLDAPTDVVSKASPDNPAPDPRALAQVHALLTHYLGDRRDDALRCNGKDHAV